MVVTGGNRAESWSRPVYGVCIPTSLVDAYDSRGKSSTSGKGPILHMNAFLLLVLLLLLCVVSAVLSCDPTLFAFLCSFNTLPSHTIVVLRLLLASEVRPGATTL